MNKAKSLSQKTINKVIGKNIRKIRKRSGADALAVSECLNVTKQSISAFERGEITMSIEKLDKLAKYFKVDVNDFFKGLYVPEKK